METNQTQLQQQYEGTRLAVAAYAAQDIKTLLSANQSQHELSAGLHSALVKQGFSVEQANSFVDKYTPVAALDQDGAGAVLFRINGTNEIATAVRGTNPSQESWFRIEGSDAVADGTIAQGELPVYQTTLIANFVLRETTPTGQSVPQFSVQGGNSNAADLARATADTLANAGGEKGNALNLVTMPVIVQTGTVLGTGNAVGPCVDAAAHSEGSPEITTLGSAIAQCSRITTVNGPGVSVAQMQSVSDQIATQAGKPQQDISSQNQLNVHTSGVSVIDGLNGGLPGDQTLLNIPGNSHSSIVAMNAAEAQYKASLGEGVADLGEIEITAPRETNTSDQEPETASPQSSSSHSKNQIEGAFNNADQSAADIKAKYPDSTQVVDATDSNDNGVVNDALPDTVAHTNSNTFTDYLDTEGANLPPAQQQALATEIDKLGLGGEGDLSFYSLPNGSALIANADGDIVGEIHLSNSGDVNIKATAIDADGNTVEVNQHINSEGDSLNQAQYNAQAQAQANASVDLFNSLMATQQWAQLDDMGKLAVLANVYSAVDTLGGNLPGDVGGLASVLSLMQGLDSGNDMLALRSGLQLGAMGLSAYSDYMADVALQMANDMMASSAVDAASSAAMDAAGSAVPYVSYVIAIQNFEQAANEEFFRNAA
jgi:hypothetical protein